MRCQYKGTAQGGSGFIDGMTCDICNPLHLLVEKHHPPLVPVEHAILPQIGIFKLFLPALHLGVVLARWSQLRQPLFQIHLGIIILVKAHEVFPFLRESHLGVVELIVLIEQLTPPILANVWVAIPALTIIARITIL